MEIIIKGSPKEIAALTLELQGRHSEEIDLAKAREIALRVKKYDERMRANQLGGSSRFSASSS